MPYFMSFPQQPFERVQSHSAGRLGSYVNVEGEICAVKIILDNSLGLCKFEDLQCFLTLEPVLMKPKYSLKHHTYSWYHCISLIFYQRDNVVLGMWYQKFCI